MMILQPDDFLSFYEWLMMPDAFGESALSFGLLSAAVLVILGLLFGYVVAATKYGPVEGFFSVARVVRDFLFRDLLGISLRRIFAMARLAVKEAIRNKVLVVVALFTLLLLLSGWFLDPGSSDPGKLYISLVVTASSYLILLLAVLVSTFSLPQEIKNKTIYTIVTKPISPLEIVIGRIVGFVAVGTMMLVPMGIASYFFVARGLRHTHEIDAIERSGKDGSGEMVSATTLDSQGHRHVILRDFSGNWTASLEHGHRHAVTVNDDGSIALSTPTDLFAGRRPIYGSLKFLDREGREKEEGINVGNEDIGGGYDYGGNPFFSARERRIYQHGYVEGGSLTAGIFTFERISPDLFPRDEFPNGIPVEMMLRAFRTVKGDIVTAVRGTVEVRNPETGAASEPKQFGVKEYKIDELILPWEMPGTRGGGSNERATLKLMEDLVSKDGKVEIRIKCIDEGQYLGMTTGDVSLRLGSSSFAWNLTKAYIDIWLQMVLVIAFGVAFSTFLSGPVAMLATGVSIALGSMAPWIYELSASMMRGSRRNLGGGPIESFVRILRQDAMTTQFDVGPYTRAIIQTIDRGLIYSMDGLATAAPKLTKMNTGDFVANGLDIFNDLVARHCVSTICYTGLAVLIGYFFLKTREVAG
jgi:hypothetical protein